MSRRTWSDNPNFGDWSVDDLRGLPSEPRLHPNGFITLDLDETHKLHVWPDPAIRTRGVGRKHDHVFAFRSTVRKGALIDRRYVLAPSILGAYHVYVVDCVDGRCHTNERPSKKLVRKSTVRFSAECFSKNIYTAGDSYEFPVETFHSSHPIGFTATVMEITDFGTAPSARILYPVVARPRDFRREPRNERERRLVWEALEHAIS